MQVAAALMAACLSVTALSAAASDAAKLYDVSIARQPLDAALKELARQTGLQVGRFSDVRGSGPVVGPLSGKYSVDHALQSLLESSGLTYQPLNDRAFIVLAPREAAGQTGDSRCLADCDPSITDCSNKQTGEDMGNQVHCAKMSYLVAGVLGFSALAASGSSYSQTVENGKADESVKTTGLEEIIVTAERREQNLQQTPIAVSAVSGETIEALNVQSLYDIERIAPNVQFGGGYGGTALFIRGIGQQQSGLLSDAGTSIYIDGVYRPRTTANSTNFSGAQRVEVLRGPQGTLFGKNAIGGALNIVTVRPEDEFGADIQAQAGSRNRLKTGAGVNIPVMQDRLAARFSVESNRQDGYMKDLENGDKLSDTDYYTARANVLWNLSEDFTITFRGDYTDQDQNGFGIKSLATPNPQYLTGGKYETRSTGASYNRSSDTGVSMTVEWDVGPGKITSITAQRHWTQDWATDSDGTPDPINTVHSTADAAENFVSQELQYSAQMLDGRLSFTAGAFFMDEHVLEAATLRTATSTSRTYLDNWRDQTTKSYALFGQGTYALTSQANLTLGMRYSRDEKEAGFLNYNVTSSTFNIDEYRTSEYSALTPKVTFDYRIAPEFMTYLTVSRGFKAGGFNGLVTRADGFRPFGPEYLWNYELGAKSEWLDKRLRLNLAAYRMDYTDIQLNFRDDVSGTNSIENAGDARIHGIEAELNALITPSLLLTASYGLNDFEFTDIARGAQGVTESTIPPYSPRSTATVGAEYTIDLLRRGKLVLRNDYAWRSKTYFDAANTENFAQGPYGVWNARATYWGEGDRWSIFAYGSNLSNTYFILRGAQGSGQTYTLPAPPREVGMGFSVAFGR